MSLLARRCFLIFFLAGMPALIYQVVWQRVLTLYFGVDIYSTTVTVATFMLGLGLGSLGGGRLADRAGRGSLRIYVGAELLLGLFGAASLPLFQAAGRFLAGAPLAVVILADFALLLGPTFLMGMTLPLMIRIAADREQHLGGRIAGLYGWNTLGSACGALLAAYLLIGLLGLQGAVYSAAAMNLVIAGLILLLVGRLPREAGGWAATAGRLPGAGPVAAEDARRLHPSGVLALSLLSGMTALGYELVCYRVLSCILHGTVYVFGTILFFYLGGIALGSVLARRRIDQGGCARRFAFCQLGVAAYLLLLFCVLGHLSWLPGLKHLLSASTFTSFHPAPGLFRGDFSLYNIYSLLDSGLWAVVIVFLPALLMGYGFPNLMREAARTVGTAGRSIGAVYCANIAGSVLGSALVGFVILHHLGSEATLRVMILLGALTAALVFGALLRASRGGDRAGIRGLTAAGAVILLAVLFFPGRMQVIRAIHFADQPGVSFTGREDRSGVVVLRRQERIIAFPEEERILGRERLLIDGATHGGFGREERSIPARDSAVEAALAAHRAPRRVLSIGLGDGKMCASAVAAEEVAELVIVELSSVLDDVLRKTTQGERIFSSGKVRYVEDDGRRWLAAHPQERFDVILMWPLHALHAYSGNLFSLEFLGMLREHLAAEGLLFLRSDDLQATARTVATLFPHVIRLGEAVYIASPSPLGFDPGRLPYAPELFLSMIEADRATILAQTAGARVNRDLWPQSEYYVTYPHLASIVFGGRARSYTIPERTALADLIRGPAGNSR